ncbi:MAG TPA: peptide-methionine (S)-S-oxide reductase MsrA [Candidatus Binataceae bacterium]|nr:peptide-methionine (S)-S-oxide reductase MsrA [Candidatus Binataceae bacterium]
MARKRIATFGGGCFWGVEAAFRELDGVAAATSGYMGGWLKHPTYRQVCADQTGHAEVVQVEYDPAVVSYEQLLELFWEIHDPTTMNRQGPDVGAQYRSAIFYHDAKQKAAAAASLRRLEESGEFGGPIVTQIVPASIFYRAEEYHQRYYERMGIAPHCGIRRLKAAAD